MALPTKQLVAEDGIALLEVLFGGVALGIAIVGLALLFSLGQTSVLAEGDDRVALYLAQQRMEQLRTLGYDYVLSGTTTEAAGTIPGFPGFSRQTAVAVLADPDGSGLPQAAKTITISVQPSWRMADPCPPFSVPGCVRITGMMFRH